MRSFSTILASFCLALSSAASAEPTGLYRADQGPELAAELLLRPDGTYIYAMAVGALDETSRGRWREEDGTIRFVTEPTPVPPQFRQRSDAPPPAEAPFLLVTWPNGRGIAAIDILIGFDDGDPISDYTQLDGWRWPTDEKRTPRWIQLSEPVHGITSVRYPIGASTRALHFELAPNDLGVIDFTQAIASVEGNRLTLHRPDGRLKFVKMAR